MVGTIGAAARKIAHILEDGATIRLETGRSDLEPVDGARCLLLEPGEVPDESWAVDGGQVVIADALCCSVVATRAARVGMSGRHVALEDRGELEVDVLVGDEAPDLARDMGVPPDTRVDVSLLRDAREWRLVRRTVEEASPGSLVLVDGDLQPDWRLPGSVVGDIAALALERGVRMVGVTKHSSLSRGGAPLVGALEAMADADPELGRASRWWVPVAKSSANATTERLVAVARLDPAARFAFRIDILGGRRSAAPGEVLGALARLSDDASFPGYPYPLAVADRLAACPPWLRQEARSALDDELERAGVSIEVRERCFADRHRLMERS